MAREKRGGGGRGGGGGGGRRTGGESLGDRPVRGEGNGRLEAGSSRCYSL